MLPPLLAILAWPFISIVFFKTMRLPLAVLVTVVGGYLLLPENTVLDLPLLPAIGKHTIPAVSAFFLALIFMSGGRSGQYLVGMFPRHWIARLLLGVLVFGSFMTVITNSDPVSYGARVLPGLQSYDAFSTILSTIMMVFPLLLARRFLATPESQRLVLQVLCVAAVAYSFLALFEVRMSPQLNRWVYGFFPHSWVQHIRGGGFRPLVFLQHGLLLGILLSGALFATICLARLDKLRRGLLLVAALWILATLLLSKNLGAVLITFALFPAILFLGARAQLLVAALVAGIFLIYPVARTGHVLPIDQVMQLALDIDPQRASSFQTRLENEEKMLAKALERPVFGWGGWGRSRVYDEFGNDTTIADGAWVIVLGVDGWIGYLTRFGLLTVPIFLLLANGRRYQVGMETSALAVILAGNLVDMIPNSSNTPITWLVAGALWGRLELRTKVTEGHDIQPAASSRPGYRRDLVAPQAPPSGESAILPPQKAYTRQKERISRTRASLK